MESSGPIVKRSPMGTTATSSPAAPINFMSENRAVSQAKYSVASGSVSSKPPAVPPSEPSGNIELCRATVSLTLPNGSLIEPPMFMGWVLFTPCLPSQSQIS